MNTIKTHITDLVPLIMIVFLVIYACAILTKGTSADPNVKEKEKEVIKIQPLDKTKPTTTIIVGTKIVIVNNNNEVLVTIGNDTTPFIEAYDSKGRLRRIDLSKLMDKASVFSEEFPK